MVAKYYNTSVYTNYVGYIIGKTYFSTTGVQC